LFREGLKVDDLPEFWNDKSENILGFRPKTNREGCLQDVHWSSGSFGYFPSYCLGNMLAAQIWYALREQMPDIDDKISRAQFQPILNWLREQVHHHGRRYSTQELIKKISGKELSPGFLVRYLKERYLTLYT
jgi:carboxypeptidase Taq